MKCKGVRQWGIGHTYPLETVVGTDLVVRVNTCDGGVIQELIEHVLGVQGGLLTLYRQYQEGSQND
jgi:hypothetical protein